MPTSYKSVPGDTFGSIARKILGDDLKAHRIAALNSGTPSPIPAGTTVLVPDNVGTDIPLAQIGADPRQPAIYINGELLENWSNFSFSTPIDTFHSFNFSAPYDSKNAPLRELFKPMAFNSTQVYLGDSLEVNGVMLDPKPVPDGAGTAVAVAGYSLPGVLNDCNPAAGALPLEFENATLADIAGILVDLFGLQAEYDAAAGSPFSKLRVAPTANIFQFLTGLVKQRRFLLTNTPAGRVLFRRVVAAGAPVANFVRGVEPYMGVVPAFAPQQYHSEITVLQHIKKGSRSKKTNGKAGGKYTKKNPFPINMARPRTYQATDSEGGDLQSIAEYLLGLMFADAVSYVLPVPTWFDASGNLWRPNTTITVDDPERMINGPYELLIKGVDFQRAPGEQAALSLTLPCAYGGDIPERLPWD